MARLISYKVKDESEYATFVDGRAEDLREGRANEEKWWRCRDCCGWCGSDEEECDDDGKNLELALIKHTKVVRKRSRDVKVTQILTCRPFEFTNKCR